MAKESMKAREVKRAKLVARYAEKRAALKKVIATTEDPAEAYEAARKLQSIPKNANPIRSFAYPIPRDGFCRSDPWCEEG